MKFQQQSLEKLQRMVIERVSMHQEKKKRRIQNLPTAVYFSLEGDPILPYQLKDGKASEVVHRGLRWNLKSP